MPAIKRVHKVKSSEYIGLVGESARMGENNDCWVKAIALVADISYEQAHAYCKDAGRRKGCGLYTAMGRTILLALGYEMVRMDIEIEVQRRYDRKKTGGYQYKWITPHHVTLYPEAFDADQVYLMFTARHVTVVKGNEVHDWAKGTRKHVINMYRVVKKKEVA
jgi:hypothetical protein